LVVVESPSKCQTIAKILHAYTTEHQLPYDFVVTSSMGHVRNIPPSKQHPDELVAGIDVDHQYQPTYTIIPGKEQLVQDLKQLAQNAEQLILATDDDREGEAMAWHLLELLQNSNRDLHHHDNKEQQPQPPFVRVRFTEITPKAIVKAISNPEPTLRQNLVQAQETRRVLDRLAGFTVSPVLWKKIAPGLSAGRVQSVGMALIVQRERERLLFQETEYWSVQGNFSSIIEDTDKRGQDRLLDATLISINGQTLASGTADFDPRQSNHLTESSVHKLHLQASDAATLVRRIQQEGGSWTWTIQKVTSTKREQNPPVPFITSSLQQESNRRLGLSVSDTMRAAQQLYEGGFISYMRTDSTHLSDDAKSAIQSEIIADFGGPDKYIAWMGDRGKKKQNGSATDNNKPDPQAAHEAIRPAIQNSGRFTKPNDLPPTFDGAAKDVYRLVYQRAVASHMPPQISNQTSMTIVGQSSAIGNETEVLFRSSGSVVVDPGYTIVYPRPSDPSSPVVPNLQEGDRLDCDGVEALMHMTQPPPRYNEASFVQELETLGVGRPSTYAGTVQILRDRAYVGSPGTSDHQRTGSVTEVSGPAISAQRAAGGEEFTGRRNPRGPMVPSLTAFVVTSLLEKHCNIYVDPNFTAKMEERLDKIANSDVKISDDERVTYLDEFFRGEEGLQSRIKYIEDSVNAEDARRADLPSLVVDSSKADDRVGLFVGPWGPFVKKVSKSKNPEDKSVTASLPPGMATDLSSITLTSLNALLKSKEEGSILGAHPEDGRPIHLKVGPYGAYLQWGDDGMEGTTTHTLPRELRSLRNLDVGESDDHEKEDLVSLLGVSLDVAIQYISLPRTVCKMNDLPIVASLGPYGPYLKYNNTFLSLSPNDGDVLGIDEEKACALVTERIVNGKKKSGAGVLVEIGVMNGNMIVIKNGRFGPYIKWKNIKVTLPVEYRNDPSSLSLDEAWSRIEEKAAAAPGGSSKSKRTSKSTGPMSPTGPKRPPSAYLIFSAEKRCEVASKFSSLGEVSKELSRLWKESTEEDKQPYMDKAAALKELYDAEKREWNGPTKNVIESGTKSQGSRLRGETNGLPTRPRSSYIFFCNEKRAEVSKSLTSLVEVSKELARRWADLDDVSRRDYEDMASADTERYQKDMASYSGDNSDVSLDLPTTTLNGHTVPKKKKRKKSAYMMFCASRRNEIVDKDGKKLSLPETTKILAQMWKECDDETREKFFSLAESDTQVLTS
jgi:DNA topoisomerase I